MSVLPSPIFQRLEADLWEATAHARGPFTGVHGGSVAALLSTAMEEAAPGYQPLAFRSEFLRPTPLGQPLRLRVATLQTGRRIAVLDATLEAEGRVTARASLTLAMAVELPNLTRDHDPAPHAVPARPEELPTRPAPAAHGAPWIMDVMDRRIAPDGAFWFRWGVPLLAGEEASAHALALGPADFAHGLARPGFPGASPVAGFPNCDMAVHVDRQPRGEWLGVLPYTRWRRNGLGIGGGTLLDCDGAFGQVAMGVVLLP